MTQSKSDGAIYLSGRARRGWGWRGLRRFGRREDGGAAVEFILMSPVIISLLVFAAEYGRVLSHEQAISQNLRGGAQYLSRIPLDILAPDSSDPDATSVNCAETPLRRARRIVLTGDPAEDRGAPYLWWSQPDSINCSVERITGDAISSRFEVWIVRLDATVQVDVPLLSFLSGTALGSLAKITISRTEGARVLEGLEASASGVGGS